MNLFALIFELFAMIWLLFQPTTVTRTNEDDAAFFAKQSRQAIENTGNLVLFLAILLIFIASL